MVFGGAGVSDASCSGSIALAMPPRSRSIAAAPTDSKRQPTSVAAATRKEER